MFVWLSVLHWILFRSNNNELQIWEAQWTSKKFTQVFWRIIRKHKKERVFPTPCSKWDFDHRDAEHQKKKKKKLLNNQKKERKKNYEHYSWKRKGFPKIGVFLRIKDSEFFKLWMWLASSLGSRGNELEELKGRRCRKALSLMEE